MIANTFDIHEPKRGRWVRQCPQVDVHFSPIHAPWLNQMGVCFGLRARHALRGVILISVQRLVKRCIRAPAKDLDATGINAARFVRDGGT